TTRNFGTVPPPELEGKRPMTTLERQLLPDERPPPTRQRHLVRRPLASASASARVDLGPRRSHCPGLSQNRRQARARKARPDVPARPGFGCHTSQGDRSMSPAPGPAIVGLQDRSGRPRGAGSRPGRGAGARGIYSSLFFVHNNLFYFEGAVSSYRTI